MGEFRWNGLSAGSDGLFDTTTRVVGRGAYRGLTFHEVEARTIINTPPSGTPWFDHTINAYRGCSHACVYCFARPTHDYLGFDIGEDFDTQIVVKVNAVELTRLETAPGRWPGGAIAMGTNTDPYQAAEGRYKLTRGIIEVLTERSNPFSILTKSPLVLRDLDLIAAAARKTEVSVSFSVATLDEDVWRRTEPGTAHPQKRLDALARLREAGVPGGVFMAPVLPGISDRPDQIAKVRKAAHAAGATWCRTGLLHLRGVRSHFLDWLARDSPELMDEYLERYPERRRRRPVRSSSPRDPAQLTLDV